MALSALPGASALTQLDSAFNELDAMFSPDGQWVTYVTDESGRSEVYVAPFARPTEKHQVSNDGGGRPRWRRDGRGIYYRNRGAQLREAELRIAGDAVEVTSVTSVFGRVSSLGGYGYDVSADEQRVLGAIAIRRPAEPITLIQNRQASLKR